MKVLVLNSAWRPNGATTELARSFVEGAETAGVETETVMLRDLTIGCCANCLRCYDFPGDGIAPCSLRDDMDDLVRRIAEADGILFASPVHNGFVSGPMTVFWERLSWRVARPYGPFLRFMGLKSRIDDKVRALGSIVTAGGMPTNLRKLCDLGTPWLKSNATLMLHGQWIGDMYAGAELERVPESDEDWRRVYHLRRLSARQRSQARALGERMSTAILGGRLRPVTMDGMVHPVLRWALGGYLALRPPYRLAD